MPVYKTVSEWYDANPLYRFRMKHGLSIGNFVSAYFPIVERMVCRSTISRWERGETTPNSVHMRALKEFTLDMSIRRNWYRWLADRPQEVETK